MNSSLLGKKHTVKQAERTLSLARSALRKGDKRLASSRALTAAVQAAVASVNKSSSIVNRADEVILSAREIIQGIVISRVVSRLGRVS